MEYQQFLFQRICIQCIHYFIQRNIVSSQSYTQIILYQYRQRCLSFTCFLLYESCLVQVVIFITLNRLVVYRCRHQYINLTSDGISCYYSSMAGEKTGTIVYDYNGTVQNVVYD